MKCVLEKCEGIAFQVGCELVGIKSTHTDEHILRICFTKAIEKGDYREHKQMQVYLYGFPLIPGCTMIYVTACVILLAERVLPGLRNQPDFVY